MIRGHELSGCGLLEGREYWAGGGKGENNWDKYNSIINTCT